MPDCHSSPDYANYLPEIDRLQQIDHLNIPRYLHSLATPTGFCVVRAYQPGISLAEIGELPPSDLKLVAAAVLEILKYLHQLMPAILHQNIKPENIIVNDADLSGANLTGTNFDRAAVYGAKSIGTNLVGANLDRAKLVYAKLKGAVVRNTNFSNADLRFAELQQVDLTNANFTGADLSNADLSYANLRHAILTGTKLDGASLTGATMPDGSTHP
ncbi:pentapeptide repeat-containing protein [Chamaesiphon sp.]|uniref:pentapeptide repeat-containing protein n=1 Tax=Chamaesiphon sp. TaxID=2814140 RepID=UPI0035943DB6